MDRNASIAKVGYEFECLVKEIIRKNSFQIEEPLSRDDFDFLVSLDRKKFVIEVKYYRTQRAQISLLKIAAARLAVSSDPVDTTGVLIISSKLEPNVKEALEQEYNIILADQDDLILWATSVPELIDPLFSILEIDNINVDKHAGKQLDAVFKNAEGISDHPLANREKHARIEVIEESEGDKLISELEKIAFGKKTWKKYETQCEKILKYLFPNDLYGWHSQLRTDDGLDRYDFVCRVRPATDFWKFLIEQLNSQYIIFEFKNYKEKIAQGQMLTTEKYLLEKALRKVAILLTRNGASDSATKMARGAMRDSGKMMLVLDDTKLIEMIKMKQVGSDPTDYLFELADNFLLTLSR